MTNTIDKQIKLIKTFIMAGRPQEALDGIERLLTIIEHTQPDTAATERLQACIAELRELAEAALTGARSAADQIQEIIKVARSLETYDQRGKRRIADTAAAQPRRY